MPMYINLSHRGSEPTHRRVEAGERGSPREMYTSMYPLRQSQKGSIMEEWDAETEVLRLELASLQGARNAAADGTELYAIHQRAADRVNCAWTAHRLARPVLADLYAERARASTVRARDSLAARDAVGDWTRGAVCCGIGAVVALVIGTRFAAPWWVGTLGAVLLAGCALALVVAALAHRDATVTDTESSEPDGRIREIERACRSCASTQDLAALATLLHPQPASDVARVR